ncbi:MAG: cytochrome c3 family protein [Pseudomonadota bacterium]
MAYRGVAVILFIYLGSGLASSQLRNSGPDPVSEKCILCHVDFYEVSLKAQYQHMPVFDGKCVTCHLPDGSSGLSRSAAVADTRITGTLVSQESLWAKQFVHPVSADKAMEHIADLGNLVLTKQYRFRIILSETKKRTKTATMVTSWFGLAPQEVVAGGKNILCAGDMSSFPEEMVPSPEIYGRSGSHVFVSWQTKLPLFAWLELQELSGIGSEKLSSVTDGAVTVLNTKELATEALHDQMRDPESLAIDACYSCHPEADLGTSHPVRLYANGTDTKIPEELPTIDGMMTCVTCHDPHGSEAVQLVREKIKTKLCVACHYKFKGKSRSTIFD